MDESQFAERIAQVRARFAAKLVDKLQQTDSALPHLAGDGTESADAVEAAYRRLHDVCGIAPTVGFEETGRAARILDAILIGPFRDRRGLSNDELTRLKDGLAALRIVAQTELHQRTQ